MVGERSNGGKTEQVCVVRAPGSAQAVNTLDFRDREAADTWQRPPAVRHDNGHHDFIGPWGIGHTGFHGVEMAAHVSRILVAQGHVDGRAEAAHLLAGWHQSGALLNRHTQWCAQLGVEDGGGVYISENTAI